MLLEMSFPLWLWSSGLDWRCFQYFLVRLCLVKQSSEGILLRVLQYLPKETIRQYVTSSRGHVFIFIYFLNGKETVKIKTLPLEGTL